MSNQYYDDGEEEAAEAQRRIDDILSGGGQAPQQQQPADNYGDPLGGSPRVELRSRAARSALGLDQEEEIQPRQRTRQGQGGRQPAPRAQQAIMIIGGIVLLGVITVGIIVVLANMSKPGAGISLPFISTATPTPTETPTPTATATATATVPPLSLPNLTCLVQSTTGCLTYCQNIDNLQECDQARAAVENQKADFTVFLKCLEPSPGANTGNAQDCMEEAYRARNP
jgi:hypothetical protein